MEIEEDNQVAFEDAMSWLPSHVVAEACDYNSKVFFLLFPAIFSPPFQFSFLDHGSETHRDWQAHWRNESSRGRRHGLKFAADSAVPVVRVFFQIFHF